MSDARIAVFFGAGASCAEGAPTQAGLFNAYFSFNRADNDHIPALHASIFNFDWDNHIPSLEALEEARRKWEAEKAAA